MYPLNATNIVETTVATYTAPAGEWVFLLLYAAFITATYIVTRSPLIVSMFTWLTSAALLAGDLFFDIALVQSGIEPLLWATTVLSLALTIYQLFGSQR